MSCSGSKDWSGLLAVIGGTMAGSMPLVAPLGILTTALGFAANIADNNSPLRALRIALGISILGATFAGYFDCPLATALLSAGVLLSRTDTASIGIAVLLAQTSAAASLTALAGQKLPTGLEAAAPALVTITCLWLSRPFEVGLAGLSLASSLVFAGIVNVAGGLPPWPMLVAGLGPVAFAGVLVRHPERRPLIGTCAVLAAIISVLSTWAWTPPRTPERLAVLLPSQPDSYSAQFFQNYVQALTFAGVGASIAKKPQDIPANSAVLLPWLTDPLALGGSSDEELGALARDRSWTTFVIGEHTNLGEVADRVARITGKHSLLNDLTVPPLNRDESGHLHVAGIRAWPRDAILNRGASVSISSAFDRVLLAGDGWWSEKDIGEWLWVGDYIWRPGDQAGRITLAASIDDGASRWIVVGDNSPFINRQLVADPRPLLHLLSEASLWPAFIRDATLFTAAILGLVPFGAVTVLTGTTIVMGVSCWIGSPPSERWKLLYRGESGFADRNFNDMLLRHPKLLNPSGWLLVRRSSIPDHSTLPTGNRVIFTLVEGTLRLGDAHISQCRRLGLVKTTEGPTILDGQACRVEGPAEVMLGTKTSAAAIRLASDGAELIVVFDTAFLARSAPEENATWLMQSMKVD